MMVMEGSSADGAVGVSLKFHLLHLVHPRTCRIGRLDRRVGLLRVRELRRRCRPEDNWPVRARAVPGGRLRRH
jgi:hypothetical protein